MQKGELKYSQFNYQKDNIILARLRLCNGGAKVLSTRSGNRTLTTNVIIELLEEGNQILIQ